MERRGARTEVERQAVMTGGCVDRVTMDRAHDSPIQNRGMLIGDKQVLNVFSARINNDYR